MEIKERIKKQNHVNYAHLRSLKQWALDGSISIQYITLCARRSSLTGRPFYYILLCTHVFSKRLLMFNLPVWICISAWEALNSKAEK